LRYKIFKDERQQLLYAAKTMMEIVNRHDDLECLVNDGSSYNETERAELLATASSLLELAGNKLLVEKMVQKKALELSSQIVEFINYCESDNDNK
jgi:hypothetical protein